MIYHNPQTHKSILLIAHTSFYQPNTKWKCISPLLIEGIIDEILFESPINHLQEKESVRNFKRSNEYTNGLEHTKVYFNINFMIEQSFDF